MRTGRPRQRPANLPGHVDWDRVPRGVYWDRKWRRWYVKTPSTKYVASADAKLSDLHAIAESLAGVARGTVRWLCEEFAKSPQFKSLSKATQTDYGYCRGVLCEWKTKAGPFGDLVASRITRPLVQRLVDAIAAGTDGKPTPSKAQHVRRYMSRVWEWGANRGHVPPTNPATGIDAPSERKQRRLPSLATIEAVRKIADGYLPHVMELAYLARLRGVEVVTLTEGAATTDGLRTNRRKGSRDNVVAWTPRLRAAWDALVARRDGIWSKRKTPVPIKAESRPVVVASDGHKLSKPALDTAWQRLMTRAVEAGVIAEAHRFGLHDLKRRGVTDTAGTRADKQEASGHRAASMMDTYDLSLPVVKPAGEE
jgi:integrase